MWFYEIGDFKQIARGAKEVPANVSLENYLKQESPSLCDFTTKMLGYLANFEAFSSALATNICGTCVDCFVHVERRSSLTECSSKV